MNRRVVTQQTRATLSLNLKIHLANYWLEGFHETCVTSTTMFVNSKLLRAQLIIKLGICALETGESGYEVQQEPTLCESD